MPGAGSLELLQEVRACTWPVILFMPRRTPGSHVSVGCSALCHKTSPSWCRRTRFPLSKMTATVPLELLPKMTTFEDQTSSPTSLVSTRLPSGATAS